MTAKERVLKWITHADFDGTGCRHSQETIAAGAQCSRRTVIRAVAELEAEGLRVVRARRNSRVCNVYHVPNWTPQRRSGVLNVLAQRRENRYRAGQCHTERTATATAKPQRKDYPSLRDEVLENQRCGREGKDEFGCSTEPATTAAKPSTRTRASPGIASLGGNAKPLLPHGEAAATSRYASLATSLRAIRASLEPSVGLRRGKTRCSSGERAKR